jgi:hypothetical protein
VRFLKPLHLNLKATLKKMLKTRGEFRFGENRGDHAESEQVEKVVLKMKKTRGSKGR